jgi:hypothetical protein
MYEDLKEYEPSPDIVSFVEGLKSGEIAPYESMLYGILFKMMYEYEGESKPYHQPIIDDAVEEFTKRVSGMKVPKAIVSRVEYTVSYMVKVFPHTVSVFCATGKEIITCPYKRAYLGECCLFHIDDQQMLFVGHEVYRFWLFGDDRAIEFRCQEGEEGRLEYYLVGEQNTYLLTNLYTYIPNSKLTGDPYDFVRSKNLGYRIDAQVVHGMYSDLDYPNLIEPFNTLDEEEEFPVVEEEFPVVEEEFPVIEEEFPIVEEPC